MLLECDICNALVKGEIIGSYVNKNEYDWVESVQYTLCKCPSCSSPILAHQEYDYVAGDLEWGMAIKMFPSNAFHINPIIPEKLRKALVECIQCYKSKSYTATAIMCRRAIEGFCSIRGVEERNLDLSIKKLRDEGIINEQLFEWANQLRLVGNEAAHNIDSEFTSIDAKDILDFTIAILDFTYSFKDKFDRFKARTQKEPKI